MLAQLVFAHDTNSQRLHTERGRGATEWQSASCNSDTRFDLVTTVRTNIGAWLRFTFASHTVGPSCLERWRSYNEISPASILYVHTAAKQVSFNH